MKKPNEAIGKCFIDKKPCDKECVLYRAGVRYTDDGKKSWPFEECALNIMADCLENVVSRMVGLQQEGNHVRNSVQNLSSFFKDAATAASQRRLRGN
jgi:hypothetical protein